jgi:hypothetical protein
MDAGDFLDKRGSGGRLVTTEVKMLYFGSDIALKIGS